MTLLHTTLGTGNKWNVSKFYERPILSWLLNSRFLSVLIHQQYILLWTVISHCFISFKRKTKLVPEMNIICDIIQHTKKHIVTNEELLELSVYIYLNNCRDLPSKQLEANFKALFRMELTTDATKLFLLAFTYFTNFSLIQRFLKVTYKNNWYKFLKKNDKTCTS